MNSISKLKKPEITAGKFLNSLDDLPQGLRVCLYGAGETGNCFKKILDEKRKDVCVVYFIDSFRSGEENGTKVINIRDIAQYKNDFDCIIVTSVFWNQIENMLKQLEIDNYYILSNYLLFLTSQLKDLSPYHFTDTELDDRRNKIDSVISLLEKPKDRELYRALIDIRKANSYTGIEYLKEMSCESKHYFDHIQFDKIQTIIEGGVFDGADTVEFYKHLSDTGIIYGFEPFYDVFLNGKYRSFFENKPNVKVFPLALWSKEEKLRFGQSDEILSDTRVFQAQDDMEAKDIIEVDAVSIDEFVFENMIQKVDLIKMDIEGAELDALHGAKNTIMAHRPQLAISIYHKREHLYEIPLFLDSILDNYIFRLSQYTPTFIDTVWYAIPEEILNDDINE